MESQKNKSPERGSLGSQNGTEKSTAESLAHAAAGVNSDRFLDLLARQGITLRGPRRVVPCIFHQEKTPSLSIDIGRGLFHCFGCGVGGGVKAFALAVGEPWSTSHLNTRERARFAVQARRREAEAKARAILTRRKDERDNSLWADWGQANTTVTEAADLLSFFFRHPDLAAEFPHLVQVTESEYSNAFFRKLTLEQRFAGEVA